MTDTNNAPQPGRGAIPDHEVSTLIYGVPPENPSGSAAGLTDGETPAADEGQQDPTDTAAE